MLQLYLSILCSEEDKIKFTYIYENFNDLLYNVIAGIVESHADAEEALSDTYFKILKNIAIIETTNKDYAKHYILKIGKTCAYDKLRENSRQKKIAQKNALQIEEQYTNDIIKEIENQELNDNVLKAFLKLPEIYREVRRRGSMSFCGRTV